MLPAELIAEIGPEEFKSRLMANLEALASANPDFRYVTEEQCRMPGSVRCRYNSGPCKEDGINGPIPLEGCTEEQSKGCIFGRALRAMGIELGNSTLGILSYLSGDSMCDFSLKCRRIQGLQDTGTKWGDLPIADLKGL
jgi:hypothetical protein